MVDILGEFVGPHNREVVALHRPAAGLQVDPEVRGGHPVIEGTRVPYDLVAALLEDGLSPEDIGQFYPTVGPAAARGASDFSRYVNGYRTPIPA